MAIEYYVKRDSDHTIVATRETSESAVKTKNDLTGLFYGDDAPETFRVFYSPDALAAYIEKHAA